MWLMPHNHHAYLQEQEDPIPYGERVVSLVALYPELTEQHL